MWDENINVNILRDRKSDVLIPQGINQDVLNHIPCSHNSCIASSSSRFCCCCSAKGLENYAQAESWSMIYSYNAVSTTTALPEPHQSIPVTYQHSSCRLAGCIFGILGVWLHGRRGTGFDLQLYCFLRGCNGQSSSESHHHRKWCTGRETQKESQFLPRTTKEASLTPPQSTERKSEKITKSPLELGPLWDQVVIKHSSVIVEIQVKSRCEFRKSLVLEAAGMTLA